MAFSNPAIGGKKEERAEKKKGGGVTKTFAAPKMSGDPSVKSKESQIKDNSTNKGGEVLLSL